MMAFLRRGLMGHPLATAQAVHERLPKDASIREVARKMKALDVGMIPVYDGDRLVGMVTDRDITLRVVAAAA
jgi:predicted transcriptional regulator